jgi:DNA invertase Pin-like site-specific DNA recombinase
MRAQRFAVYVRRSARDELKPDEQETSTEQQLRLCMDHAKRQGWVVPTQHVYDEGAGVSASDYSNGTRVKFAAMLTALERREVDGLLVWKLDRATRNSKDTARLADLQDDGLQVASVVEGAPTGLMLEWMGLVAKQQARDISVNSRRGKASLARKGLPSGGGRRRFGFEADQVTLREDEAELIREAARRILAGEGTNTVCKDWNRRGLTMPGGSVWQATPLRRILLQPRTAGLRQQRTCQRKERKGGHRHSQDCSTITGKAVWKPILDQGTWNRLRVVLTDSKRQQPGHPPHWLLSGLAKCRGCGKGQLYGRLKDEKLTYTCQRGTTGCGMRINGTALEAFVEGATLDWLAGDGLVKARQQLAQREADHEAIQAQLQADEARLADLADLYANGAIDVPEWMRARSPIERRITKAREKLSQVPELAAVADLPSTKKALARTWKKLPVASKRAILKAIIHRFEITPGVPGKTGVDLERVTLVFIDREQPDRKFSWPADHDASDRRRIKEAQRPHETDETVLDVVARSMEEPSP